MPKRIVILIVALILAAYMSTMLIPRKKLGVDMDEVNKKINQVRTELNSEWEEKLKQLTAKIGSSTSSSTPTPSSEKTTLPPAKTTPPPEPVDESIVVESNSVGNWKYRKTVPQVNDTLIVIGGSICPKNVMDELLNAGFLVWISNYVCLDKDHPQLYCKEQQGYVRYLSDKDPKRPIRDRIAFLHGHGPKWHTGGIDPMLLLTTALNCSRGYDGFVSLHPLIYADSMWLHNPYWAGYGPQWNTYFSEFTGVLETRRRAPQSAQFVVPKSFITRNDSFWEKAKELTVNKPVLNSQFWEYSWHVAFGLPVQLDVYNLIPQCLPANNKFVSLAYDKKVNELLTGVIVPDRYMQEIKTENTGDDWKTDTIVVLGEHIDGVNPELVSSLQKSGYNLWVRHPEGFGCKLLKQEDCNYVAGYLIYLRRKYRKKYQTVVFMRGDETDLSIIKKIEEARSCSHQHNQYVGLGSAMIEDIKVRLDDIRKRIKSATLLDGNEYRERHNHQVRVMQKLPGYGEKDWPFEDFTGELLPRIGGHFVVTQEMIDMIPHDYFGWLLDNFNSHVRSPLVETFELYWHLSFGAPSSLANTSNDICQPYKPRQYKRVV